MFKINKMHFSSYPLENEMCSNVQRESPGTSRAAMLDEATSFRISGSYADHLPSVFDTNSQNQIMCGYPVYSAVEGEPICDLLASAHISTRPVYIQSDTFISRGTQSHGGGDVTQARYPLDGGTESQEQFGEGTLVPVTMLAGLLASRGCAFGSVDDPGVCGSINSRALCYEGDPSTSFTSNYDNRMQGNMVDIWAQPHPVIHGGPLDSHTAEKGYYQDNMASLVADYPYAPAMFSNELSLSLATTVQDRCSMLSHSGITNHHDSGRGSEQSSSVKKNEWYLNYASSRASQPLQTPSGSSYLWAVQQLLADLATFSLENMNSGCYSSCSTGNAVLTSCAYVESDGSESSQVGTLSLQRQDVNSKKKQLKALLKMLDEGHSKCLREVHSIMSAFHPITGLDPELHLRFVLQTTSFLFKSVKDRINTQMLNMKADLRSDSTKEQEKAFESSFIHKQWALQQLRRKEHQLWRPQRGLPEQSVSVLRAWMFQNFLHPYPKDSEKHMLAIKSGLTRSQVSNWFINARVRLWKPMIEEMYAEISKRKAHRKVPVTENSERGHLGVGNQRFQCD